MTARVVKSFDEKLLAGIPVGTWMGISDDQERIVATGRSIDAVFKKAEKAGEKKKPYIYRIPKSNIGLIL
jgi:hypothetical protein